MGRAETRRQERRARKDRKDLRLAKKGEEGSRRWQNGRQGNARTQLICLLLSTYLVLRLALWGVYGDKGGGVKNLGREVMGYGSREINRRHGYGGL